MINTPLGRRFPFVGLAFKNLTRARARSILAMAGIMIGVVAIASLGMFGAAFEQSQLNNAGTAISTVGVFPGEDADSRHLDQRDLSRIKQYAGDGTVYTVSSSFTRVSAFQTTKSARVVGLSEPRDFVTASEGRIPDDWRTGVAVGSQLADTLGVKVGDSIQVGGENRRVIAVLAEQSRGSWVRVDDDVLVPQSEFESNTYSRILVRADRPEEAFEISSRLDTNLNDRKQKYNIMDAESSLERFQRTMAQIDTLLLSIGGVSLLVASVSILNVMLMSTIERREEIGVLRAVGYHRLDILRLILIEAAVLGLLGAIAGVVLSIGLGMLINAEFLSDPLAFTGEALMYTALGFVFGTAASFLSGLYPAWKAANARPVEALRD